MNKKPLCEYDPITETLTLNLDTVQKKTKKRLSKKAKKTNLMYIMDLTKSVFFK